MRTWILLALMTSFSLNATAAVEEMKLQLKLGKGLPIESPEARMPVIAEQLKAANSEFTLEDPVCAALVWYCARQSFTGELPSKYAGIGRRNFNLAQQWSKQIRTAGFPEEFARAWRSYLADEIIRYRMPRKALEQEVDQVAKVPTDGQWVTAATAEAAQTALAKAYPALTGWSVDRQLAALNWLDLVNPGVELHGFCQADSLSAKQRGTHLVAPVGTNGDRLHLYRYSGPGIYLPPVAWLETRSASGSPGEVAMLQAPGRSLVPAKKLSTAATEIHGQWAWYKDHAPASDKPETGLVEKLSAATKLWESDQPIPAGRGPDTRGKARKVESGPLSGACATPIIADGRVFQFYYEPAGEAYAYEEARKAVANGEDPAAWKINLIEATDILHCFDAATGQTLWKWGHERKGLNWAGFNKNGPQLTPAYGNGRFFVLGTAGRVYGIDANSGQTMWQAPLGPRARMLERLRAVKKERGGMLFTRSDFETCVVPAGDVVVCVDQLRNAMQVDGDSEREFRHEFHNGLIAYDQNSGVIRWRAPEMCDDWPLPWQLQNRPVLVAYGVQGLVCLDAGTGEVIWRDTEVQMNTAPTLAGNRLLAVVRKGKQNVPACYQLGPNGAKLLWKSDIEILGGFSPAVWQERAYYTTRQTGVNCLDLNTGKVLATAGEQDHYNNGFCEAVAGRLLLTPDQCHVKPIITYFDITKPELRHLETWATDITGGYSTPIMAPVVDGRLFLRMKDRLACYDLRLQQ